MKFPINRYITLININLNGHYEYKVIGYTTETNPQYILGLPEQNYVFVSKKESIETNYRLVPEAVEVDKTSLFRVQKKLCDIQNKAIYDHTYKIKWQDLTPAIQEIMQILERTKD